MNYELTLKGYHSIRIVGLNTSMVFSSSYLVSIKIISEKLLITFHDLK